MTHRHNHKKILVLENLKLKSGWDERVTFLECECGDLETFPKYSLHCALGDGTSQTVSRLKRLGFWV